MRLETDLSRFDEIILEVPVVFLIMSKLKYITVHNYNFVYCDRTLFSSGNHLAVLT